MITVIKGAPVLFGLGVLLSIALVWYIQYRRYQPELDRLNTEIAQRKQELHDLGGKP